MIGANPIGYLDWQLEQVAGSFDTYDPRALEDYRSAFANAEVRSVMFDDYRAAMGVDLDHERNDREDGHKVRRPVLYLGNGPQAAGESWTSWADSVVAEQVDGSHMLPETAPEVVTRHLITFLRSNATCDGAAHI
nr:Fluoroacetate dehalogenase [Mycolicibacterium sp.]